MADPFESANGAGDALAHPVEITTTEKTARGRTARTPFLAVTGVAAVLVLVALLVYFLV